MGKLGDMSGLSTATMMRTLRWAGLFAFLAVATAGHAQSDGPVKGKVEPQVLERLSRGEVVELTVEFSQADANRAVKAMQASRALAADHPDLVAARAARFKSIKDRVRSSMAVGDGEWLDDFSHLPFAQWKVRSADALQRMLARADIVAVHQPRQERKALAESLPMIAQNQAAAAGFVGAGTTVVVLDTGVDYLRPAFGSCPAPGASGCKIAASLEFASEDYSRDDDNHGTNVAAIVLGVAPAARVVAIDVFEPTTGLAPSSVILKGINWAIANKAAYNIAAINMSLGGGSYKTADYGVYYTAVANAKLAGIVTVAASGNEGVKDAISSPAATPGVVAVGAVYDSDMGVMSFSKCTDLITGADRVTCFSNSSAQLALLAPGSTITAAGILMSGTSQATPHVAGAVAVLRAAYPADTVDQLIGRLTTGVPVTDRRNDLTRPRLDLSLALGIKGGCSYTLSETNRTVSAVGATATVAVNTSATCTWSAATAASSAGWISVSSTASKSGTGTISYTVASNPNTYARTGYLTVAGQAIMVTQTGSSGAIVDLIRNGDFEQGPEAWYTKAANGDAIISTERQPTGAGSWSAWLCGYNLCSDVMYQDVTIPAGVSSAKLSYRYLVTTNETALVTPFDTMTVRVYAPATAATGVTLASYSNLNASSTWASSPTFDLTAYRGQTVRLHFSGSSDFSKSTSFFVDDVKLVATGATADVAAPTTPAAVAAQPIDASRITVAWLAATDNVGVTGYRVYRNGSLLATLGNVTNYVDKGLAASTSYQYSVAACDAAGNCSALSTSATASTLGSFVDTIPPTTPLGLFGVAGGTTSIQLYWFSSFDTVGVTQYRIYRDGVLSRILGNVTFFTDTGLTPRTSYGYSVAACDAAGNCSAPSAVTKVSTGNPLSGISSLKLLGKSDYSTSGSSVALNIEEIRNEAFGGHSGSLRIELWGLKAPYTGGSVTGYIASSIRTASVAGLSDVLNGGSSFRNIKLNLPYTAPPTGWQTMTLFLLEYSSDKSVCSQPDGFCIVDYLTYHELTKPSVPAGLVAVPVGPNQVSISWQPAYDASGIASYVLSRNGVVFAVLGNVTNFVDVGLNPSTAYTYTVTACDTNNNCSDASTPAKAVTLPPADYAAPTVPTGLSAVAVSSTHVVLTWAPSSDNVGVTAYKVYSSGNLVSTLGPVNSSQRLNAPATTYRYSVSACDAAGNCSARSSEVYVTTPAASQPAVSTATLVAPWVTQSTDYVSRFVMANHADSEVDYSVSFLTEAGTVLTPNAANLTGKLKAKAETVINLTDLIASTSGKPWASALVTVSGITEAVSGVYNVVNPITGSISNTTLMPMGGNGSGRWVLPTVSTNPTTQNQFVFSNAGSVDQTVVMTPLVPSGTTATVKQSTWVVAAGTQRIVRTDEFASLTGGDQIGVQLNVSGPPASFAGLYQTLNPTTGSVSNTSLMAPSMAVSSSVRLVMPWFSINPDYLSAFYLVNRGNTPAAYSVGVYAEPGNSLTKTGKTGVIPAGGQVRIPALDIVTGFVSAPRGGVVFTVSGSESDIDGVYQISNPSTGSVSNSPLVRPSNLIASATTLAVPWFSINPDYVSRFVFMNRSAIPVPVGVTVRSEGNNSGTQVADSFVIPANSLYVLPATNIVSAFSGAPRASIVFNIAAAPGDIDGLYNIVNPKTGSISNTMMLRTTPD